MLVIFGDLGFNFKVTGKANCQVSIVGSMLVKYLISADNISDVLPTVCPTKLC